ncbi:MAG TPA: hypothetical protein DCE42_07080 [Myxococcales bacterium]|nr:hypothetical protein [Myxococcales bacterium]
MNLSIEHYIAPKTLGDLWAYLHQQDTPTGFLYGGLDLFPHTTQHTPPTTWIDLTRITELASIEEHEGHIAIGASTTYTSLCHTPLLQRHAHALVQAASCVQSWQMRNRITIGETIALASSEACILPALYALNASVKLEDGYKERTLPISEYLQMTERNPKEVLTAIILPKQAIHSVFLMRGLHNNLPMAKVSVAVSCIIQEGVYRQVRIALGAVSSKIIRAVTAEGLMEGQPITHLPLIDRAADEARRAARPSSDIYSNARFRKWIVGILTSRAFQMMIANAQTLVVSQDPSTQTEDTEEPVSPHTQEETVTDTPKE